MPRLPAMGSVLVRLYPPLLVFALCSAVAMLYLNGRAEQMRRQEAQTVSMVLETSKVEFLKNLNSVMYLATGVVAYIEASNGFVDSRQTISWLRSLHDYNPYIRNIGIAPANRIKFIYPVEGNEKALGLYYPEQPQQWPRVELAIRLRKPVVDGPINLVQGGVGLVHRAPVFLADGRYWGMVSTVMRLDSIMSELQAQAARQGVELRFLHGGRLPAQQGDWYAINVPVEDLHWQIAGRKVGPVRGGLGHHVFWAWAFVLLLTLAAAMLNALSWRQRELQATLNESLKLFKVAFQHVPHGLLILDKAQRIVEANPVIQALLEKPARDIHGARLMEVIAPGQRAGLVRLLAGAPEEAHLTAESELLGPAGGKAVPVELGIVRLQHELLGSLVFIRDIRESRRLQLIQNEFISTASHELRTPLTSIIGALDLLRSGTFGELPMAAGPLLDMATSNSDRLHRLINDLLDTNRLMQGRMDLVVRPVSADEVAQRVMAALMPLSMQGRVALKLELACAPRVMADEDKLEQVLINLLANAIRFSPEGGEVIVRMRCDEARIHFSVQDFGRGIDPSFAAKAFTRFGQADSSDAREQGGTGLGLYICKGLVERMQGRIGYESRLGEGTTFWFELPAAD